MDKNLGEVPYPKNLICDRSNHTKMLVISSIFGTDSPTTKMECKGTFLFLSSTTIEQRDKRSDI